MDGVTRSTLLTTSAAGHHPFGLARALIARRLIGVYKSLLPTAAAITTTTGHSPFRLSRLGLT